MSSRLVWRQCGLVFLFTLALHFLFLLNLLLHRLFPINDQHAAKKYTKNNSSKSVPPHLIGLYEACKYGEKHGRLCSFGILSKILHHGTIRLLDADQNNSMK